MSEPVVFHVIVDNVDSVLLFYNELRVYRSTVSSAGPWTEVTSSGGTYPRIPLSASQTVYTVAHREGAPTDWYTTRYGHSSTLVESSNNRVFRGDDDGAQEILTVEELKTNYLFGLDLVHPRTRQAMPDTIFAEYIRQAVSLAEVQLDISIRRRVINEDVPGSDRGRLNYGPEQTDYRRPDFTNFMFNDLQWKPIISVESVQLTFPQSLIAPFSFPPEWVYLNENAGSLQIIPAVGQAHLWVLPYSGIIQPWLDGRLPFLPGVFTINYTAGLRHVTPAIKGLIGRMASIGPLAVLGDLILGPGISSQALSLDGLAQSVKSTASATNSGYGARIVQYNREIKMMVEELRAYYRGFRMVVV